MVREGMEIDAIVHHYYKAISMPKTNYLIYLDFIFSRALKTRIFYIPVPTFVSRDVFEENTDICPARPGALFGGAGWAPVLAYSLIWPSP